MFDNILIPLDGTVSSARALPFAVALAERTHAGLTLVRQAFQPSIRFGDSAIDQQRAIMEAEEYLFSVAGELHDRGFSVQVGVPFDGSAGKWIVEEIALRHADLIVMATHDRLGPDRWLHGSVAETVVHDASVPVMLVRAPHGEQPSPRFANQDSTIIVPLDGSKFAEAALPVANELGRVLGVRIVLVGVVPEATQIVAAPDGVPLSDGPDSERLQAITQAYLEAVATRVELTGVEWVQRLGEPAVEVAALAEERSACAVVMATHGRMGPARSVLGSVAGGVLRRTSIPLMVIGPCQQQPSLPVGVAANHPAGGGSAA